MEVNAQGMSVVVSGCLEMLKQWRDTQTHYGLAVGQLNEPMWSHDSPTCAKSHILVLVPPFRHKEVATFFVMVHSDH